MRCAPGEIHKTRAHHESSVELRAGQEDGALPLHPVQHGAVEPIHAVRGLRGPRRQVAEADDAERTRADELEVRRGVDLLPQHAGERDVAGNRAPIAVESQVSQGGPEFQRPEAAALLNPELRKPGQRRVIAEMRRHERERVSHRLAVAHQRAAALDRDVHPLVRVDRGAVGAAQTVEQRPELGDQRRRTAVRGVDMKPQRLAPAQIGDLPERIDGPGVHCSGRRGHARRRQAGRPIRPDLTLEGGDVEAPRPIHRDASQAVMADPEKLDGLLEAAVTLGRCVHDQPTGRHALGPHAARRPDVAHDGEPDQVGDRSTARQDAAAVLRESDDVPHPAQHGVFDVGGGVIAARHARVEACGQELGEDGKRGRRRIHPPEEPWAPVAHRIGEHGGGDIVEEGIGVGALLRHRSLHQLAAKRVRHRRARRSRGKRRQVRGQGVDRTVAETTELLGGEVDAHGNVPVWRLARAPRVRPR